MNNILIYAHFKANNTWTLKKKPIQKMGNIEQ